MIIRHFLDKKIYIIRIRNGSKFNKKRYRSLTVPERGFIIIGHTRTGLLQHIYTRAGYLTLTAIIIIIIPYSILTHTSNRNKETKP